MKRKGISLIVLVITIIVIIILAGSIILSLSNNNPIAQAKEATFKSDADAYNSELTMTISKKYVDNSSFNPTTFNATVWDGSAPISGTIKEYIPTITNEDAKNYVIEKGKLVYVGTDSSKKDWSSKLGFAGSYVRNGLILWLDGNDFKNNSTSWFDRSGNGNNGNVSLFNYDATSGSDNNGAVIFDGVDDTVELPLLPAQTNQSLSFFTWINWKGISNDLISGIWGHYGVANNNSHFEIWTTGMRIRMGNIEKSVMTAPITNSWVQVGFVYDQTTVRYYINGVEVDSFTGSTGTILGQGRHIIGSSDYTRYFNGSIASALLYNRALSNAEILQNYSAGY